MQAFSGRELLNLWERGMGLHALDRGLLLLSTAFPDVSPEEFADWPLGRRNRALVEVHSSTFGPRLAAWTSCVRCGEKMELDLDARVLTREWPSHDAPWEPVLPVNGHSFRIPSSRDLAYAAKEGDERLAVLLLVERCRLRREEAAPLSDEDLEAVEQAMEAADPAAELRLALRCPSCHGEWDTTIDLALFLWSEIEGRARRLLWDIHTLASAYGWTQGEILRLSEARRALYLNMVRA